MAVKLVELSKSEMLIAGYLEGQRWANNRMNGKRDIAHKNGLIFSACAAEFAVHKYLNTFPDLETEEPGKYDGLTRKGGTFDVKFAEKGKNLCVMESDSKEADIFFLVQPGDRANQFILAGWATSEEVKSYPLRETAVPGGSDFRIVPVTELHAI